MTDTPDLIDGICAGCRKIMKVAPTASAVRCPSCSVVTRYAKCPHCGKVHPTNEVIQRIKCPHTGLDFDAPWKKAAPQRPVVPASAPIATGVSTAKVPPKKVPVAKRLSPKEWVKAVTFLAFAVLVVVIVASVVFHKDAGPFKGTVDKIVQLNSDQVSIVVTAHNVGRAGKATCQVSAWADGEDPYVVDSWELKSMESGGYTSFPAVFHIPNDDAAEIDHAKAVCKPT